MLRTFSVIATLCMLAICSSGKPVAAEPPTSLVPVDVLISIEQSDASSSRMLVSARDSTEYNTLKLILAALPAVDNKRTFLTVISGDESLSAPRTTGDKQIGIKVSSDTIEVFVTDGMPYAVTSRVCEALSARGPFTNVVLKSTHGLAKQFTIELEATHGRTSGKDPFGE